MKVTVNALGEVALEFSNGDGKAALEFVHSLQADARKAAQATERESTGVRQPGTGGLNALQYSTWEYLVTNDCESGVTVSAMAHDKGISVKASSQRMMTLANLGYARKVGTGKYRAETPSNG
jgi:hypothetical protein